MKAIVCGDRNYGSDPANWTVMMYILTKLPVGTLVIHGDCRGADKMADYTAKELGLDVKPFPVTLDEWRRVGLKAGPLRNERMLKFLLEGEGPRKVIAFHRDLANSKGTADMVRQAKAAGVTVEVIAE